MHRKRKLKAKLKGHKATKLQNPTPRACGIRYPVFGIHTQTSQASQAAGERVGDEKIAERRVATKASQTSQSSPRVFSEIFCSAYPETKACPPAWNVKSLKPTYQTRPKPAQQTWHLLSSKPANQNSPKPAHQAS